MCQFFSNLDNQIGFVFFHNKEKWDISASNHAVERANERMVGIDRVNMAIAMLVDQLDATPDMRSAVLAASKSKQPIFYRDDLNDLAVVLRFDLRERQMILVTCWNQTIDRQTLHKTHSALKRGYNIHAQKDQVRFIYRQEDGSRTTICRADNWEICELDDVG